MNRKGLAAELERWYCRVCTPEFILYDPLQFPRRYERRGDVEIAAVLVAAIAWGRRDLILRSAEKMFGLMGASPFDFVMGGDYTKLKDGNVHRTFFEKDLVYYCRGFRHIYSKYGNLEKLFLVSDNIWDGIFLFREEMARANKGLYSVHVANPGVGDENGSACKKINLALRWLVREGPVDLGLWKKVKPAGLYIPLDVHVARTARKYGLLERKSNDKKAVILLTEKLREFCAEDPVKYDFALFGMSALKDNV